MSFKNKEILILGLIFFVSTSCQWLSLQGEEIFRGGEGYYSFNPETILTNITQGDIDVFTLQTSTPEPPLSNSFGTVQWTEKDYFNIVQALYQFAWKESTEGWNIRRVSFSVKCQDVSEGPQVAYFILYKVVQAKEEESRFERQIIIDPSNHSVNWSESEFYPNLIRQYPIELSQYRYSIRDVLQLAERSGGEEIRMSVDNECTARAEFINTYDIWKISYVQVLKLFEVDINALTGESKIITQETKQTSP